MVAKSGRSCRRRVGDSRRCVVVVEESPKDQALADQERAASSEVDGALRRLAADLDLPLLSLPDHAFQVELVDRWRAGRSWLRGCSHVSASPSAVSGLVRRPGKVWCPRCFPGALERAMSSPARCDGCWRRGRASAVVLVPDGAGCVLWAFLCPACRPVDPEAG
jgi:hypothetical protein